MKKSLFGLFLILLCAQWSLAQNTNIEQEVINLSKEKWQWMADKNVEKLATLFHDKSKFVHMSGTWNKDRELEIYKKGEDGWKLLDLTFSKVRETHKIAH